METKTRNVGKTIPNICKRWPNSKGKAFFIKGQEFKLYFLNSKVEYVRSPTIHARCHVITVDLDLGMMYVEYLTIKTSDRWLSMTLKDYEKQIREKIQSLNQDPTNNAYKLNQFAHFGF